MTEINQFYATPDSLNEEEDESSLTIQPNGGSYAKIKSVIKSIREELDKYSLPDEIKTEADHIYREMNVTTKRGKKRDLLKFFCIYNAYKCSAFPKEPRMVADIVGIPHNEIQRAFSMFAFRLPSEHEVNKKELTPIDYLKDYLKLLNINLSCLPNLVDFGEEIIKKNPTLRKHYPQVVASGILYYYLVIRGGKIDKKRFAEKIGLSEMTISKTYNIISLSHNS